MRAFTLSLSAFVMLSLGQSAQRVFDHDDGAVDD